MDIVTSSRLIVGEGTTEQTWQQWDHHAALPIVNLDELIDTDHIVHIVAPHPDDEVLGCGGIIQQLGRRGVAVHILSVTDGERSHDEAPHRSKHMLAELRTQESLRALTVLNPHAVRVRLGVSDGEVTAAESQLGDILTGHFRAGDTVIAPWRLDGHPDHEAASRAALLAARRQRCTFLEVPIWGWHWASPADGTFPAHRAIKIALTHQEQRAKIKAIQAFQSQLHPDAESGKPAILPEFALARLTRAFEVLLR